LQESYGVFPEGPYLGFDTAEKAECAARERYDREFATRERQ
jgi:hypothetical protein